MSSDKDKGDKPKKGKGMMTKMLLGLGLIAAGGGGAFGLMAAGIIGPEHATEAPKGPQLVRKGDVDPYPVPGAAGDDTADMVYGDGGSEYRTAYFRFEDDFTSNLRDTGSLIQLSLAASTQRDGRVIMWLNKHSLALRSRILIELADTDELEVANPEGKEDLQKRLTAAINDELVNQEGFGGVDNVHFLSFIIQ